MDKLSHKHLLHQKQPQLPGATIKAGVVVCHKLQQGGGTLILPDQTDEQSGRSYLMNYMGREELLSTFELTPLEVRPTTRPCSCMRGRLCRRGIS